MAENLRIGIIGSGFIARTHAHSIAHGIRHATLAGIAGGSRAERLAAEFHCTLFQSVEALAASDTVDAAIIATPHASHHGHALLCARGNKHALVEKPMASTVQECRDIIDEFRARELCLMVAFTQRFRTSNLTAFNLIQRGTIGRLLMIQEYALLPDGLSAYPQWQQQKENLGILFGYGIHNIDKLRWFVQSEVDSVNATVIRAQTGIETSSMATIRWRNGVLTNLWSSVDLPPPGFERTAFRSLIVGDNGLIDVDGYGEVRLAHRGGQWQTVFVQPPVDWRGAGMFAEARMGSFNGQNQAFVDAVREGKDPPTTGLDGLQAVAIALAAYSSADTNQTVHPNIS